MVRDFTKFFRSRSRSPDRYIAIYLTRVSRNDITAESFGEINGRCCLPDSGRARYYDKGIL